MALMSPISLEGEKSRPWTEFLGEGGAEGSDGDHPNEASQRGDVVPTNP